MRAVVQRVTRASVTVDGELLGRIGKGFMILLGVADGDTVQMAEKMADKICRLRIFEDGTVQRIRGCGGKGTVWRGHEGGAIERRAIYPDAGQR